MAAVDSLLRLIVMRNAEALTIGSGQVPVLRKSGDAAPLSMPPLDAALVAAMVDEVLDEAARARLTAEQSAETRYRLPDGTTFALVIERRGDGFRMMCRLAAVAPPVAAPPVAAPPVLHVVASPAAPAAPRPTAEIAAELLGLLHRVEHDHASDLILSCGHRPRMRVGGELVELDAAPSTDDSIRALVAPALTDAHWRDLDLAGSTDAALDLRHTGTALRYRLNLFRQRDGLAAALRPIRRDPPTLAALHLPDDLHDLTRHASGLVLVTGRAGSGKSTTLVALIEHLNRTRSKHVITIEDPIEYEYQAQRCLIHQREVGSQVGSFAAGLRAALRESPDVILVGEMRDPETIAAALTAAETGHLVLSTMHCASAAVAVNRIIDAFPENQQHQVRLQLSTTLRAVVTQVLVPAVRPPLRFCAHEKMVVTPAVGALIREGKVHQLPSVILTSRDDGMVPLERNLAALVRNGKVTRAAAREAATDPASLDALLADGERRRA